MSQPVFFSAVSGSIRTNAITLSSINVNAGDWVIVTTALSGIFPEHITSITDGLNNTYSFSLAERSNRNSETEIWTSNITNPGSAVIQITGDQNIVAMAAIASRYAGIVSTGSSVTNHNVNSEFPNVTLASGSNFLVHAAFAIIYGTTQLPQSGSILTQTSIVGYIGESAVQGGGYVSVDAFSPTSWSASAIQLVGATGSGTGSGGGGGGGGGGSGSGGGISLQPSPTPQDWLIGTINILRNNWGLAGDLSSGNIRFTTGPYQEQFQTPQVSVTPLVEPYRTMNIGVSPTYYSQRKIRIDIWVKPKSDSNTSLGWAKNTRWQIEQEVERIIRTNATNILGIGFAKMEQFVEREDLKTRPPILNVNTRVNLIAFDNPIIGANLFPAVFDPNVFDGTVFKTQPG
jgi:hypothetical protein